MRFKVVAMDRFGHRVTRVLEAANMDEARAAMREKGYVPRQIVELRSWTRYAIWGAGLIALVLAMAVGWFVSPGLTFVLTMAAILVAAVTFHAYQTRAQHIAHAAERHAVRLQAAQDDERRRQAIERQEQALDRAVQKLLAELSRRRQDLEETRLDLQEMEATVDEVWKVDELRRRLRQRQEEIHALERELAALIPGTKEAVAK